jgi:hypothetical protein
MGLFLFVRLSKQTALLACRISNDGAMFLQQKKQASRCPDLLREQKSRGRILLNTHNTKDTNCLVSFVLCARGETRTRTTLLSEDFKSSMSTIPSLGQYLYFIVLTEAWVGIEPAYKDFADLCLTTWLPGLFYLSL